MSARASTSAPQSGHDAGSGRRTSTANCVRQPRHAPATISRRSGHDAARCAPAAGDYAHLHRQTHDVVRSRCRLQPVENVAGVQHPAVRLDRRDDAPFELGRGAADGGRGESGGDGWRGRGRGDAGAIPTGLFCEVTKNRAKPPAGRLRDDPERLRTTRTATGLRVRAHLLRRDRPRPTSKKRTRKPAARQGQSSCRGAFLRVSLSAVGAQARRATGGRMARIWRVGERKGTGGKCPAAVPVYVAVNEPTPGIPPIAGRIAERRDLEAHATDADPCIAIRAVPCDADTDCCAPSARSAAATRPKTNRLNIVTFLSLHVEPPKFARCPISLISGLLGHRRLVQDASRTEDSVPIARIERAGRPQRTP